ncbi:MAG: CHAP domain-containing protein [Leclercia adecarboxylata]|nr:CHAP domain-containing protein [uncultured Leclercia sp.]MDU4841789.1 CHAP domain-containing protein [Leclercia adecarboxylata]
METVLESLISIAHSQLGVREAFKNNTGQKIVEYQGATWLAPGAWPWCAAFTCWIMREWLEKEDVRLRLGLTTFSLAEKWRCRDASAFGWIDWATQKKMEILSENSLAKAGDFVVYDFSHIGLVIENQIVKNKKIVTIEGNTNGKGERDSLSGDGVWIKERAPSLVKNYLRINV